MYVRREHNVQYDFAHGKDTHMLDNKIPFFFFGEKILICWVTCFEFRTLINVDSMFYNHWKEYQFPCNFSYSFHQDLLLIL